jgi:hypothetical protein
MGIFTWESGNIYHGNYQNDERMGYGEMYWTDGSVYKGEWFKGIQHGKGVMSFPDGRVKDGYFENNVFKGNIPNSESAEAYAGRSPKSRDSNAGGGSER